MSEERGIRIPGDLANEPLTLNEVREILALRKVAKRAQTAIDSLPEREAALYAEITDAQQGEQVIRKNAQDRAAVAPRAD